MAWPDPTQVEFKFDSKITFAIGNSVTALKIKRTSISLYGSEMKHLTTNLQKAM